MSGPAVELKQRRVPEVDMSTTNSHTVQQEAKGRTVTCKEISEWQRDNKFILSGYRPEKGDYWDIFVSLTFVHNETCNIYTHLIGALVLPVIVLATMRYLGEPQFLNVIAMDYNMFGFFFWCAEICLILSTLFHLMQSHSHRVEQFWHGMDMLGIIICIVGTFCSGINYIFYCEELLQYLHWGINLTFGTTCGVLISNPELKTPRWRRVKVGAFFAFGASSFIPLLHGTQRYGLEYMLKYAGMKGYLGEIAFYGSGVMLYAFRIPERFAPGKFDLLCSSHQLFHVAILGGMCSHLAGLLQGFTASHTLDVCEMKGIDRAN